MANTSGLSAGTLLRNGTYRIIRFLGQGGFGCTYEAHFEMLNARVAIKEFFPESMCNRDATGRVSVPTDSNREFVGKMRRKFIEEARTLYKYKDIDGIVKVSDIFEENGTAYFVMDFIDGKSVQSLIDSRGRLSEGDALRIIESVGKALQAVHSLGSLHLDIKPDNIMIGADGRPILIDFGVSKQFNDEKGCNTSTLMGYTPGYAPLEQMNSNVHTFSAATDIYALGATLYAMLTGMRPPKASDLLNEVEALTFPGDVTPSTRAAIVAAMESKVKHRPQSVAAFLALLPSSKSAQPTPQTPQTPNPRTTETKLAAKPNPHGHVNYQASSAETKPIQKPNPQRQVNYQAYGAKPAYKPNPHGHINYHYHDPNKLKKYLWLICVIVVASIIGAAAFLLTNNQSDQQPKQMTSTQLSDNKTDMREPVVEVVELNDVELCDSVVEVVELNDVELCDSVAF